MGYREVPGYFDFENFYSGIAESCPAGSTLVEVGCWQGRSVIYLAEQFKKLNKEVSIFAVDSWRGSAEQTGPDQTLLASDYGVVFRRFVANVKANRVADIVTPVCLPSVQAAKYFADGSAYMVFIDAEHAYEAVKADIIAWRAKVQKGGTLSGHDYGWNGPDKVKRAVDEAFGSSIKLTGSVWSVKM